STATNRIGDPHTFTVTLWKDLGENKGFVKAKDEHVDVTLTDELGAAHPVPTGSCTTAGPNTDVNGQCTITFTSNSTGTVTGHATSTLTLGSATFTVQTYCMGPTSANAVTLSLHDALPISSTATNRIGDPHTFTVTLWKDVGDNKGFVKAKDEHVDVTLTNDLGAAHSVPTGSSEAAAPHQQANGQRTLTFTSNSTGTVTGHASSTLTLVGLPVTVE